MDNQLILETLKSEITHTGHLIERRENHIRDFNECIDNAIKRINKDKDLMIGMEKSIKEAAEDIQELVEKKTRLEVAITQLEGV